jgi:hypothetical protein
MNVSTLMVHQDPLGQTLWGRPSHPHLRPTEPDSPGTGPGICSVPSSVCCKARIKNHCLYQGFANSSPWVNSVCHLVFE